MTVEIVHEHGSDVIQDDEYDYIVGELDDGNQKFHLWQDGEKKLTFEWAHIAEVSQETPTVVGTVTTDPSTEEGRDLLNGLRDNYEVVLDQVHRDGQANFVIRKDE